MPDTTPLALQTLLTGVKSGPDAGGGGGGVKLGHRIYRFIKTSAADDIQPARVAGHLAGAVLFLFTAALLIAAGGARNLAGAPALHQG